MWQQREEGNKHERVPAEVDPFDVELPDDPLSRRARKMQHVDLDHLRDVLEEMGRLRKGEEAKQSDPGRRDEAVGISRRARRHV